MIEQAPTHNSSFNSPEWRFWLWKANGELPSDTNPVESAVQTGSGSFVTNGGRVNVVTINISENMPRAVLRWLLPAAAYVNMPVIIVKNGVDVFVANYPCKRAYSFYGFSDLVSGDVLKIDANYGTTGVTHTYTYELEFHKDVVYAGDNAFPVPNSEDDNVWYRYWNDIYSLLGRTEVSVIQPRNVNYVSWAWTGDNVTSGVEYEVINKTVTAVRNVYINHTTWISTNGASQAGEWKLYRDTTLLATYPNAYKLQQRRAYCDRVTPGAYTYRLKYTPTISESQKSFSGIEMYVLA